MKTIYVKRNRGGWFKWGRDTKEIEEVLTWTTDNVLQKNIWGLDTHKLKLLLRPSKGAIEVVKSDLRDWSGYATYGLGGRNFSLCTEELRRIFGKIPDKFYVRIEKVK